MWHQLNRVSAISLASTLVYGNEKRPVATLTQFQWRRAIERFSLECRNIVCSALLRYTIILKISFNFLTQSEVQPKPILTHSHTLFRYVLQRVLIDSFDCPCPLWLVRVTSFVLVLRLSWKPLYDVVCYMSNDSYKLQLYKPWRFS